MWQQYSLVDFLSGLAYEMSHKENLGADNKGSYLFLVAYIFI